MRRKLNVALSVANQGHLVWLPPAFSVKCVDTPDEVPAYDVTRFTNSNNVVLLTPEFWEDYYEYYRPTIKTAPRGQDRYSRLVVSLDRAYDPRHLHAPHGNLLTDLRRLYRTFLSDYEAFRKGVIELAQRYTPYSTYHPTLDFGDGLSLKSWLHVVMEFYVYDLFIQKLDEHNMSEVAEWVAEQRKRALRSGDKQLAQLWREVERNYCSYLDPNLESPDLLKFGKTTAKKIVGHRLKNQIANELAMRQRLAMNLRARMGQNSITLTSLPDTTTKQERYLPRLVCCVGVREWASVCLAEKLGEEGYTKLCPVCKKTFTSVREDAITCGRSRCRSKKSRHPEKYP